MLRYARVQFENRNVQILTSNYAEAIEAYKRYHRIRTDSMDGQIFLPYQKTNEFVGQVQNLKVVPSGAGVSERRISNHIQRDSWSAFKYAGRVAQILEMKYLVKPEAEKSDWDKAAKSYLQNRPMARRPQTRVIGRQGGRRFA